MTPAHAQPFRTYLSLTIAAAHAALALLGIFGRLTYAIPSRYELLREIMSSQMWIYLHAAVALVIVVALLTHRRETTALGTSVGVWAVWSFLSLIWGLSTDPPVSLVGPTLAGMVTTLAYVLTLSWATKPANEAGE